MDIDLTQTLLRDLRKLFENCEDYNVILKVGKGLSFHAHSIILKNRSEYFRTIITEYINKRGDNFSNKLFKKDFITLDMPQISADAFKIIIRYIYTGYFSFDGNGINQEFLFDLIFAADELKLYDLVKYLQIYIVESNPNWIKNNLIQIYHTSFERNFTIMQEFCMKIIEKEPTLLFKSNKLFLLKESDLIKLLKRDDLNLPEIDIWRYIIRWGIEQEPPITASEIKKWNEEFVELERRLHNLIPYIRFFSISATQYYEEVRPFSKILSDKLKDEIDAFYILSNNAPPPDALPPRRLFRRETILRRQQGLNQMRGGNNYNNINVTRMNPIYHMNNNNNDNDNNLFQMNRNSIIPTPIPPEISPYPFEKHKNLSDLDIKSKNKIMCIERENSPILNIGELNSILINRTQAKRIVRWIGDNKYFRVCGEKVNNSYMLKLLMRGTGGDGMSRETFHFLCDNKGPTVIVAKVDKSKNIIGGYNPFSWTSSNKWLQTSESFIFSFKSDGNREGFDDIILSRIKNQTAAIYDGDCTFDVGFSLDLQLFLGIYECKNYERKIMTEKNFFVTDYEVFQVVKVCDDD
ncbi:hypothetical protein C1645_802054 [Glomus cerebriforme]|uniref:BTB/POZ domain-containing protein n=1 Tax=Glomus cerebriforme TaxID=658196 RepID=A0A397TKG2_9GLOM|nr:hypothetical protein C1645_802054 [Glomus cerebriforme]